MRITDGEGRALNEVYLALSDAEAKELSDALLQLISAEKGWHAHVDDRASEHEVTVYREDDDAAVF